MLEQLASGVRVINLDQTWLSDTNFLRRKWRFRGQVNSQPSNSVAPRVGIQMAICTSGKLYCSMAQVNTDTKVFCLFMTKLAAFLNKEEQGSVGKCLLLIDGARY